MVNMTEKQKNYILMLQRQLGQTGSFVDVKLALGSRSPAFKLDQAGASRIIDALKEKVAKK